MFARKGPDKSGIERLFLGGPWFLAFPSLAIKITCRTIAQWPQCQFPRTHSAFPIAVIGIFCSTEILFRLRQPGFCRAVQRQVWCLLHYLKARDLCMSSTVWFWHSLKAKGFRIWFRRSYRKFGPGFDSFRESFVFLNFRQPFCDHLRFESLRSALVVALIRPKHNHACAKFWAPHVGP